jgi:hypothetical protein
MVAACGKIVKLSLYLINYALCHEDILGSGGTAPLFLTSELYGGDWSNSRLDRFTPEEITPSTHWIGGWLGLRGSLDVMETVTVQSINI